jgi:hypothetical protein
VTWTTFFGASDDFADLLDCILQLDGASLFEVYSRFGQQARSTSSSDDAVQTFRLGEDPNGAGVAAHCALWVPTVMPHPRRTRINLTSGTWRECIEGCGLFWLQAGGVHAQTITESRLGWFTEAGARQKCQVTPSVDDVNWSEHAKIVSLLKKSLTRLSAARARRFPVLPQAAQLHASGYRLLYGAGLKHELSVDAA